jgi:type VI secretion system secreted protein VgrG
VAKVSQAKNPMTITTPLGEDVLLIEAFSGAEGLSEPFSFDLELIALADKKILFDKVLGQPMTVKIVRPSCPDRYYHGIVNSFSQGPQLSGAEGGPTFVGYQATLVPSLWFLKKRIQSRIFQQITVPDILKKIFEGMKVTYAIEGKFEKRDYCTQYRESDFDFASRLMEEEGIFYFFKHTKTGHEMVVANTPAKHPETETPTFDFDDGGGGIRVDDQVFSWTKRQSVTSGKVTLADHCFELSNMNVTTTKPVLETVAIGTASHKLKVGGNDKLEVYEHPGRYAQRFDGIAPGGGEQAAELSKVSSDGDRTVAIRMQEATAEGLIIEGTGDARLFSAGFKFKLNKHFTGDGAYVLTHVEHRATQRGQYSGPRGKGAPFQYTNSFRCLPAALPFRPPRVTPKAKVEGPHMGVVVGPKGDEIFTDKYGRVKVQFAWERDGKNDASSSCWIRVGTPWAGQQWGMIHIPRIGQEVIVAFEEGDPDQPLIVGSVYNAANMPPYKLPDMKTQSGIKSRSTLKGTAEHFNELRFEDKKDSEDIYFHAQKDFHRVVENDDDLKVGRHQTREIKNNRTSVIKEGDDTFTIEKGSRIETLKDGNETLTMEKGSRTETLKDGDETVTLEKGKRTHKIQNDDALEVAAGKRSVKVKMDHTLDVSDGNDAISLAKGNYILDVQKGGITIKAALGKIAGQAMESIELKVGGNSIKIDQTGITIKGVMIKLEGQAMVQAKGPMVQVMADAMLTAKGGITKIG